MTAAKDGHGTGILAGLAAASLMLTRRWLLDGPTDRGASGTLARLAWPS